MIAVNRIDEARCDFQRFSPNHGSRAGPGIKLIVLHATADRGNELGAEEWMCSTKSQASAHLHIRRNGSVTRMVDDSRRAWHAGVSSWPGIIDINSESLGWEIANKNDGKEPFTDAQYKAVAKLLAHYLPQGLERKDVLSHAMVSPGRKTDPLGWSFARMWREYDALIPDIQPKVTAPTSKPPKLRLDVIDVPTRDHVAAIVGVRNLEPGAVAVGLAVAETLLRSVIAADVSRRGEVVKRVADAFADWLKEQLPPAA